VIPSARETPPPRAREELGGGLAHDWTDLRRSTYEDRRATPEKLCLLAVAVVIAMLAIVVSLYRWMRHGGELRTLTVQSAARQDALPQLDAAHERYLRAQLIAPR
jgi:hypothetical protein